MSAFIRRFGPDCSWIALILLSYVVLLAIVPPTGEFPTLDDFDYAATAWHLADRGQLTLSDWPAMTLVTHVAWGALACRLFGNSFAVLRCSICLLSCAAAVAIYCGFRRRGHSRPLAALAAVCFAVNPLTVSLQYMFMTDITGVALSTVLIACAPLPQHAAIPRLVGYSVLAGVAYMARETAAIPWIMVLLATAWSCVRRRSAWQPLVWLGAPAGLMIALFQYWLREFEGVPFNRLQPSLDWTALLRDPQRLVYMASGLGLALAPLALATFPILCRRHGRKWCLLPIAAGVCGLALVCVGIEVTPPYRDELFDLGLRPPESPIGRVPASLQGTTISLFGAETSVIRAAATGAAWFFAAALGLTLALLRPAAAEQPQSASASIPVATMTLLSMAALYLVTLGFVDRYLLSLIPPTLLMLAERLPPRVESRPGLLLGWSAATLVALASLVGIQDAMVRSRSFFAAAERLQQRGVSPFDIDAGFAFGGMYRFNPLYRGDPDRGPFWNSVPPGERSTVMASVHPLTTTLNRKYRISFDDEPGYRSIDRVPYAAWFRRGEVRIYERAANNADRR